MAEQSEKKQEKKLGFFKKLYYSITKFEKFPEMAAQGMAQAFKYLAQVMLVFSLIVSIGLTIELHETVKKGKNYIQNELPDMNYKEGILHVESNEAIKIDTEMPGINQIIIDTNTEQKEQIDEYVNSITTSNTGLIVLKDRIIVKAINTNQRVEYKYEDILKDTLNLNKDNLSKQDIIELLSGSGIISIYFMFLVFMIMYVFLIYSISVLVDTILIATLGSITVLFTKLKLKFSAVYNMSIYALTLSILLNAIYLLINSITGFELRYFQIMYTSIAYVYLVAAIFMIRIDFEKKQAELMKIMEEQEKVKQEMTEQKEQEEKDQNNKPEEDDETEGDNKKQEDQKEEGEPSGSEA